MINRLIVVGALTMLIAVACGNVAPTPYNDFPPPPPDYLTQAATGGFSASATPAPAIPGGETAFVATVVACGNLLLAPVTPSA